MSTVQQFNNYSPVLHVTSAAFSKLKFLVSLTVGTLSTLKRLRDIYVILLTTHGHFFFNFD